MEDTLPVTQSSSLRSRCTAWLALATICSLGAACGVHVRTSGMGGGGGNPPPRPEPKPAATSPSTSHDGATTAPSTPGKKPVYGVNGINDPADEATVLEYFRKLEFNQVADVNTAGIYFPDHIKTRPLFHPYKIPDPDKEWLPNWSQVKAAALDDAGWEALAQAAVNRTWSKQCVADYADWRAQWKKIEAKSGLAAIEADKNPYQRIRKLTELRKKLMEDASAAKITLKKDHPHAWSGVYFEATRLLMETFHGTRRSFIAAHFVDINQLQFMAKWGRSLSDDGLERDMFCGFGMQQGTHRTIALPTFGSRASVKAAVKWPVPPERMKELETELAKGREARTKTMSVPDAINTPILFALVASPDKSEPKLYFMKGLKVTSVAGGKVELAGKDTWSFNYDCHTTNKIERIEPDGRVVYQQLCKLGKKERTGIMHLTLSDLPSDVTLVVGDEIQGYVDVDSAKDSDMKTSPGFASWRTEWTATARHVKEILRADKVIVSWW